MMHDRFWKTSATIGQGRRALRGERERALETSVLLVFILPLNFLPS